jgi:hypothetical protein
VIPAELALAEQEYRNEQDVVRQLRSESHGIADNAGSGDDMSRFNMSGFRETVRTSQKLTSRIHKIDIVVDPTLPCGVKRDRARGEAIPLD